MGCHGNHVITNNQMGVLLKNIEFLLLVASLNHLKTISNAPRNSRSIKQSISLRNISKVFSHFYFTLMQGRRRLFESGTATEDRRCSSSADGTRGEMTRGGLTPLSPGGFWGPPPRKFYNSR